MKYKNILISNLFVLFVLIFSSCEKDIETDSNNTNNPSEPVASKKYILDSIVTEEQPGSVCSGCRFLVRGVKNYLYNQEGKVWKIISVSAYSNNNIAYDTTILDIENGKAYQSNYGRVVGSPEQPIQGRKELGPIGSLNNVLMPVKVTKSYKINQPADQGTVDTLESGVNDVQYDNFGRISRYGYQYFQTILMKSTYPLMRKIIAFPYQINYQNDKDGVLGYQYIIKVIDDEQRKNSSNENWFFLKNYPALENGINYYSPYFRKDEVIIERTSNKVLNPPFLFYVSIPETFLVKKKSTQSYISSDTTKEWVLTKSASIQHQEITMDGEFVKSYKVVDQNSKLLSITTYYFRIL
jgi:hypothetical protein